MIYIIFKMRKTTGIYILFLFSLAFCIQDLQMQGPKFKCRFDEYKINPQPSTIIIPDEKRENIKNFASDNEVFKDFNIYLDLENFYYELEEYDILRHKNLFLNGMQKAVKTLQTLLKVKPPTYNFQFSDQNLIDMKIKKWDKTKIGDETFKDKKGMRTLGIDLYIFVKFTDYNELGLRTIAYAGPVYSDRNSKRPLIGLVTINKSINYKIPNSQQYFEETILHEFTHILGFGLNYFTDLNMVFKKKDIYGIERYYVNSPKVLEVAKKYFNCKSIDGVPLENSGEEGTAGSHWEERILLGEYMIGNEYNEEQVISEFTLALLEDLGFYKANYYTGGLMKFGKNKGCEFVNSKCVNNEKVNPKFKNEFFDNYLNPNYIDPGCTSGRLSRVYHYLEDHYQPIPEPFDYFDPSYGGRSSAEYCPVFTENTAIDGKMYYLGHCSYGSSNYGSYLSTSNGDLQIYTKEKYSDNSFCVLSTLIHSSINMPARYSGAFRAVCYEMHCSDQSLTIQINNDFIVCPRAGGKIQATNFNGFILCPDYYLICSGTVLCNDLFDCVNKKSLLKDITYDYEIRTTQDLVASKDEKFYEDNYELSTNGKCPQNCKQCDQYGYCITCRNHYKIVELKINYKISKICVNENKLNNGYFINDKNSIYYKCLENCDKCENQETCISCKSGYKLSDNGDSCQRQINILLIIIPFIISLIIIATIIMFVVKNICKRRRDLEEEVNKIYFKKDNNYFQEDLID